MRAWVVDHCFPIAEGPLLRVERELPVPAAGQIRVRVSCCGVCRTDLHLAEGDLPPKHPAVVPGHEIVCAAPVFTGWDVDGGYADACLVDEAFAYALPGFLSDEKAAPLLCAGIIGYRSLLAADVPAGGSLGIYGFGGSAHLTAQVALHLGLRVHVLTRGEHNRDLAAKLGVDTVGSAADAPPELLDGAILFAPAGGLVPVALRALAPGATLAVAGIWLSDIPTLQYEDALFNERRLRSVTANTRRDGEEFLALAARFAISATTVSYPMADAPTALADLAHGRFGGAAVLHN